MAILCSDNFNGPDGGFSGRTLNNALGGTETKTWTIAQNPWILTSNVAWSTNYGSMALVNVPTANKLRARIRTAASNNRSALLANGDNQGNGPGVIAYLSTDNDAIVLRQMNSGDFFGPDRNSTAISVSNNTEYYMELERTSSSYTARLYSSDGVTLIGTVAYDFGGDAASFTGEYWGITNYSGDNIAALNAVYYADAGGTAPTITTTELANAIVGSAYNQAVTATGDAPIAWSLSAGLLPSGLSLDSDTGVISGTPASVGTFTFTVQALNGGGSDTQEFSIDVGDIPGMRFPLSLQLQLNEATTKKEYLETIRDAIGANYKVVGRSSGTPIVTLAFTGQLSIQSFQIRISPPYNTLTMSSGTASGLTWRVESSDGSVWGEFEEPLELTNDPAAGKGLTISEPITIDAPASLPDGDTPPPEPGELNTTVTLSADPSITPTSEELVTFGLPIAVGQVTSLNQIRVRRNGVEIPVFVGEGLRWHWIDNSHRSVRIQCVVDMTDGDVTLSIDAQGRNTANDLTESPYTDGLVSSGYTDNATTPGASRALLTPRVLPLHDPSHLAQCGIVAPFAPPASTPDTYDQWLQWIDTGSRAGGGGQPLWTSAFDYASTSSEEAWLYDRISVLFQQSWSTRDRSTRISFLRHAAISKYHYWARVVSSGTYKGEWINPNQSTSATGNEDFKYFTTESAKLALALLGDNTQWDASLIDAMADRARARGMGYFGFNFDTFLSTGEYDIFTERAIGVYLSILRNAWEITETAQHKNYIDTTIERLRTVQTEGSYAEQTFGWEKSGAWAHNWEPHEGDGPTLGMTASAHTAGATIIYGKYVQPPAPDATWHWALDSDMLQLKAGHYINIVGSGIYQLTADATVTGDNQTFQLAITPGLSGSVAQNQQIRFGSTNGTDKRSPGASINHALSPWMTALIGRELWECYWAFDTGTPKTQCAEILRELGWAMETHCYDSVYSGGSYSRRKNVFTVGEYFGDWITSGNARCYYVRFMYMSGDGLAPNASSGDAHAPEVASMLSYAMYFESDSNKRAQMRERLMQTDAEFWSWPNDLRARMYSTTYIRTVAWRDRPNPYRTWKFVEQEIA